MAMRYRARYVPKKTEENPGNGSSSDSNDRGGDTPVTPPPTPKTLYKIYGASKESTTPLTKDDVHFLDEMENLSLITFGEDQLGVFGYWAVAVPTSLFTGKKVYLDNHELVGGYKTENITLDGSPYILIADQDREELSVINLSIR
nr:MAG TPA: hypothetical protein [Caudoviricetes sp.]